MKRNTAIAGITAALVIAGATATAVAFSGPAPEHRPAASADIVRGHPDDDQRGRDTDDDSPGHGAAGDDHRHGAGHDRRAAATTDDDDDAGHDGRDDDAAVTESRVSAAEAIAAALKKQPGTVESVDFDWDRTGGHWEADILGEDNRWYEVTVDAASGATTVRADD